MDWRGGDRRRALQGKWQSGWHATEWRDSIVVSPGARVEFIVEAPPAGVPAMLVTKAVNTGPGGENDPNRPLISIVASPDAAAPSSTLPVSAGPLPAPALPWLGKRNAGARAEALFLGRRPGPSDPNSPTNFYLTVEGPNARYLRSGHRHTEHRSEARRCRGLDHREPLHGTARLPHPPDPFRGSRVAGGSR